MKTYFTFGSAETFPYQNTYLIIEGVSQEDCMTDFRRRYPDITEGVLNCAFAYSQEEWEKVKGRFDGIEPVKNHCTEEYINSFGDLFIFIPSEKQILCISEGTGGNLMDEDEDAGYVDYIDYEQYSVEAEFPEVDGGNIMMKEYVRDKYNQLVDCIPDVLEFAYGKRDMEYTVLCIV